MDKITKQEFIDKILEEIKNNPDNSFQEQYLALIAYYMIGVNDFHYKNVTFTELNIDKEDFELITVLTKKQNKQYKLDIIKNYLTSFLTAVAIFYILYKIINIDWIYALLIFMIYLIIDFFATKKSLPRKLERLYQRRIDRYVNPEILNFVRFYTQQ